MSETIYNNIGVFRREGNRPSPGGIMCPLLQVLYCKDRQNTQPEMTDYIFYLILLNEYINDKAYANTYPCMKAYHGC